MFSTATFVLRDIFTTNAASPPVETEPATISPTVVKQNGHIVKPPGVAKPATLSRLLYR